jgi:tetratricopeptide (TPR) repeat protein
MKPASYPLARQPAAPRRNHAAEKIQVLWTLAQREYDAGRMAEVERACIEVLLIDTRHADALYLLGMVGYATGRFAMAERMIRRAIAINGRQAFYHCNLGNALRAQGKADESAACFQRALQIQPDHAEACYNLGNILLAKKNFDEAGEYYRRALAVKPDYADAWCNLGSALRAQDKVDEAAECFRRALALTPNNADLNYNLGDTLHAQGKVAEAVGFFRRTMALNPVHFMACNCLCNAHYDLGDLPAAIAWCDRALTLKPDYGNALMNRCLLQLLQGDYANGWRNYEVRWKVFAPRAFTQPLWRGEPLHGAGIVLYSEQGQGDALQFLRYVPLVQAAGGKVILDLPANLLRLAAQIPGLAGLVATGEPLPPFDCRCPLLSLPLTLGTTLETIPAKVPYLAVPPEAKASADALPWPATGLRVGLSWTGNPTHPKNRARSVPLEMLAPLFDLPGVHFFSLQMGPAAAELAALKARITDLAPVTGDMADTAAQMAHLDLIISIDTSIAHLAGALGRPLWVLLSKVPDWRWLLDREDSPWYPSARLFRQSRPGDWQPVIERVRTGLLEMAARKQAAQALPLHLPSAAQLAVQPSM